MDSLSTEPAGKPEIFISIRLRENWGIPVADRMWGHEIPHMLPVGVRTTVAFLEGRSWADYVNTALYHVTSNFAPKQVLTKATRDGCGCSLQFYLCWRGVVHNPMSITERRKRPNVGAPEALTAVRSDESEVPMATCVYLKNTVLGGKKNLLGGCEVFKRSFCWRYIVKY